MNSKSSARLLVPTINSAEEPFMSKCSCDHGVDRRGMLTMAGIGLPAALAAMSVSAIPVRADAPEIKTPRSPDESLAALKEGNARYVAAPELCLPKLTEQRASVVAGQAPWATIVSCADSRVPPELIFGGRGPGELFVARNAGNLVDVGAIGTVEYGAAVLGSPLIVVLGHSKCGAVEAACKIVTENATYPGSIGPMIDPIVPAALAVRNKSGDFLANTIRESAVRTARRLTTASSILADMAESGKLKILAAEYDLESGKVDFFESDAG
jgi:carbonic anhydrase